MVLVLFLGTLYLEIVFGLFTAESWCTPYYYFQVMHFCHILDLRFQFEIQFSVLLGV